MSNVTVLKYYAYLFLSMFTHCKNRAWELQHQKLLVRLYCFASSVLSSMLCVFSVYRLSLILVPFVGTTVCILEGKATHALEVHISS